MLRLTTLGAIDLRDRLGHPVREVLAQPKRVALLAYLAVESRKGPVPRDRLMALFWPESDAARARNALSQALHQLRQRLGKDVIESHVPNAVAVGSQGLWCDATAFLDALQRGESELALDLYRGEFCPALFGRDAPELEQWLDTERQHLRGKALAAARRLAEQLAARGDGPGAVRAARRALAMQPDDEGDARALLLLQEGGGDRAGALQAYQEYARRLAVELETEPEGETVRLAEAMRRRRDEAVEPPASPATPPPTPASAPVAPATPASAPLRPGPRRTILLTAMAAALLAVASLVILKWPGRQRVKPSVMTLAVFPFTLRGGAPLGYLHDGMVHLLSAKFDGASGIRAIDPRSVLSALASEGSGEMTSADASAEIARRLGAGYYITGDVLEVAGRLQLNGTLVDLSGDPRTVATASVAGDTAALFELVDDLAGRMLARLSSSRDTSLTELAAVTTHSLPALRRYLDGERALREGHDAQAAAAFREAAVLDTGFALAQYRLALSATWANAPGAEDPAAWAATAARHSERLTPLARDLLAAYTAYKDLRGEEAERLYRASVDSHPDNVEAWFMLGEVLFHYNFWRGRSPLEAWTPFNRVLELDPTNSHAMVHLARLAAAEGRMADLDSLVRRYRERYPDADRALEMQALQAYAQDDPEARKAVAEGARGGDDYVLISLLQAALQFSQNLDAARDLAGPFRESGGTSPNRVVGWRYLAELDVAGGRWGRKREALARGPNAREDDAWVLETEALLAVEPLLPIPRDRIVALRDSIAARQPYRALISPTIKPPVDLGSEMQAYLLGLLSARLGDTSAARRYESVLTAIREEPAAAAASALAMGLRAEIARSQGDLKLALAEVEEFPFIISTPGIRSLSHWGLHERFLRAELLHALGRDQEAVPWYDSFHGAYDVGYMAMAHYRLGEISLALGDRERAAFHFGRAFRAWKGADPEFEPLVAKATAGMRDGEK
jgi:DNA-binding SARP family transcriptional activator/TolB-like protein/TolA-binding protein